MGDTVNFKKLLSTLDDNDKITVKIHSTGVEFKTLVKVFKSTPTFNKYMGHESRTVSDKYYELFDVKSYSEIKKQRGVG